MRAFCRAAWKSQGFDEWIIRANAADSAGHFAEAARLYERAYATSGFDPTSLALAAMSAAKAGQNSLALADLRRAIEQGFLRADFLRYLEGDSTFARIRADPRFEAILQLAHRRNAALDTTLRAELLVLADKDQQNRAGIEAVITRFGSASREGDSAMKAMTAADAPLLARLKEIVAAHGWPGRSVVGDDGAHGAWLIAQHAPAEYQRQVLPLVQAAVRAGERALGDGALLEDRVLVADGKPQCMDRRRDRRSTAAHPRSTRCSTKPASRSVARPLAWNRLPRT